MPPRSLDLEKKEFGGVGRPGDFEPAPRQRAALDRRAVVIGQELAAIDAAANLLALKILRKKPEVDVDQIGGAAIAGDVIAGPPVARGRDLEIGRAHV